MATKITKIQVRRDTALNWQSVNPILSVGEFALTTDSQIPGGQFKIGDGVTPWETLVPFGAGEKGTFNEVTLNGPFQGGSGVGFPIGTPNFAGIDGVPNPNQYATSSRGIYTRGLATYHHIFPVDGYEDTLADDTTRVVNPTIGRPNARFSEVYVKGNSLHIGDDNDHEIVLSHLRGATEPAKLIINNTTTVGGRVTEVVFPDTTADRGRGYRVGQGLSVKYNDIFADKTGYGLRINITKVDADGAIEEFSIQDPGGGYEKNQVVEVVLRSQLGIARREPFGNDFTVTELATKEALEQVTAQSLNLIGPSSSPVPYIQNIRGLPEFQGPENQENFNIWTRASLEHLDRSKLQTQNCTGVTGGSGPNLNAQGLPEYRLLINTAAGPYNSAFGLGSGNFKGGEILFFNDNEQWEIVSSAGSGGTGGPEEDPIFLASAAYRIEERDVLNVPTVTYTPPNVISLMSKPLMYIDDWNNIPKLN